MNSKLFTLVLICLVSIGTLSRKKKDLNPKTQIGYPLALGMLILFSGLWLQGRILIIRIRIPPGVVNTGRTDPGVKP